MQAALGQAAPVLDPLPAEPFPTSYPFQSEPSPTSPGARVLQFPIRTTAPWWARALGWGGRAMGVAGLILLPLTLKSDGGGWDDEEKNPIHSTSSLNSIQAQNYLDLHYGPAWRHDFYRAMTNVELPEKTEALDDLEFYNLVRHLKMILPEYPFFGIVNMVIAQYGMPVSSASPVAEGSGVRAEGGADAAAASVVFISSLYDAKNKRNVVRFRILDDGDLTAVAREIKTQLPKLVASTDVEFHLEGEVFDSAAQKTLSDELQKLVSGCTVYVVFEPVNTSLPPDSQGAVVPPSGATSKARTEGHVHLNPIIPEEGIFGVEIAAEQLMSPNYLPLLIRRVAEQVPTAKELRIRVVGDGSDLVTEKNVSDQLGPLRANHPPKGVKTFRMMRIIIVIGTNEVAEFKMIVFRNSWGVVPIRREDPLADLEESAGVLHEWLRDSADPDSHPPSRPK